VNGSSVTEVISVLFRETLVIVFVSILVASAGSYLVMNRWLTDYAQRIHINAGYFLLSALFVVAIAFIAIIGQAWRAATNNPLEALRHE